MASECRPITLYVLFSALLYEITDPFLGLSVRERIQHLVNVTKDIIDMRLIGLVRCPLLFLGLLDLLGSLLDLLLLSCHSASHPSQSVCTLCWRVTLRRRLVRLGSAGTVSIVGPGAWSGAVNTSVSSLAA